jgi:SAM-dependent methyltransferase
MKYNQQIIQWWKGPHGIKHIIPPNAPEFPEGWDVRDTLISIIGNDSIVEVGCGRGRLAGKFEPAQYIGVDINPNAIARAKGDNPNHTFVNHNVGDDIPESTWVMFYTVLLHVDDNDIDDLLSHTTRKCSKVIVAEVMGREWRRADLPNKPPVFNRSRDEYVVLLEKQGFSLTGEMNRQYEHIKRGADITFLWFGREQ